MCKKGNFLFTMIKIHRAFQMIKHVPRAFSAAFQLLSLCRPSSLKVWNNYFSHFSIGHTGVSLCGLNGNWIWSTCLIGLCYKSLISLDLEANVNLGGYMKKLVKLNSIGREDTLCPSSNLLFVPTRIKWNELALAPDENFKTYTQQFPQLFKMLPVLRKKISEQRLTVLFLLVLSDKSYFNDSVLWL